MVVRHIAAVLIALNATVLLAASPGEPILKLPVGTLPGSAGIESGGQDTGLTGPNALDVSADGRLFVLDQLNRRISIVSRARVPEGTGGASEYRVIESRPIPSSLKVPTTMVAPEGQPVVLDGSNLSTAIVGLPGRPASETTSAAGSATDSAMSLFRTEGLVGADGSSPRRLEGTGGGGTTAQTIAFADSKARAIAISFQRAADGRNATLTLNPAGQQDVTVRITTAGHLGAAIPLRLVESRSTQRLFVKVEDLDAQGDESLKVQSFALEGSSARLVEEFVPPLGEVDALPDRPFAVDGEGRVFFLGIKSNGAWIWELRARPGKTIARARKKRGAAAESTSVPQAMSVSATGPTNPNASKRADILARGAQFAQVGQWTVARTSLQYKRSDGVVIEGARDECRPKSASMHEWASPGRLVEAHVNDVVDFVPYAWGQRRNVHDLVTRLKAGETAGNVCTCEPDCILRAAIGIDCSGLVSEIWDAKRFTTKTIKDYGHSLGTKWSLLEAGDVVSASNKNQRHMMLVTAVSADGPSLRFQMLHASIGAPPAWCNGSVCKTTWEPAQLKVRGYTIYRHPDLAR
jgi:hypothetical protein